MKDESQQTNTRPNRYLENLKPNERRTSYSMGEIPKKETNIPHLEKIRERLRNSGNYQACENVSILILDYFDDNPSKIQTYFLILSSIVLDSLDISALNLESRLETFLKKHDGCRLIEKHDGSKIIDKPDGCRFT